MGDFNYELSEDPIQMFCNTYNLKCLVKEPTCFKNDENPSCIDLILTNKSLCFQNAKVIETGLSDFYKLSICIMKPNFHKEKPIIVKYSNYKYVNIDHFRNYYIR